MGEAARGQSFPPDRSRPAEHAVVPAGLIGGVMDNRRPSGVVRWPVMTLGARGIPARGPAPPRTPALPLRKYFVGVCVVARMGPGCIRSPLVFCVWDSHSAPLL